MSFLSRISGLLIFLSFLTTLYSYFFNEKLLIFAGVFAWISFLILFSSLKNKKIIIVLLILSFLAFFVSYFNGFKIDFIKVFTFD